MDIKPTSNRLLVRQPKKEEKTTDSGIITSTVQSEIDTEDILEWIGVVVEVGPELKDSRIQVGTKVVLDPSMPLPMFRHGGMEELHCIITELQVLSIIE